ncbi:hypothetical protein BGZ58_000156, partial [Dissophora ornata]
MSQVRTRRPSLQSPGVSRTLSSQSLGLPNRPRRININLPKHSSTNAAFVSLATGASTLTDEVAAQERARYTMLVAKNTTSEALLKMPNVATKPVSLEGIEDGSQWENIACNLPRAAPAPLSNMKMTIEDEPLMAFPPGHQ